MLMRATFGEPVAGMAGMLAVVLVCACSSCGSQQATKPPPIPMPTGSLTDVEGNVYPTIKIGQQEWMVKNLKTVTYNDGTPIPNVTDGPTWSTLASDAYSWYDNAVGNKDVYGALYNWYAVNTKKLCPTGWSMPSNGSWSTLVTAVGGDSVAGGRTKEVGTTLWQPPNTGATNQSGFSARPAGFRNVAGSFDEKGQNGIWWSSDQKIVSLPGTAYFSHVTSTSSALVSATSPFTTGYSVRCFRSAN
ncbi:MAG TPA: fibrobacter succinogenes major paralogous domain-containing protein [Polyangia bacterium]|jgi:uncharacterized protein (TIGR02145 family)|nr:fibrobacter succinogenes major paralogous domain-containing protein [Polyangia bacterium]